MPANIYFRRYVIHYTAKLKSIQYGTQPTFTCSKLTIESLEKGVKYVQS